MKLIIQQEFLAAPGAGIKGRARHIGFARKELEDPPAYPRVGDMIESSLWKDEQPVEAVNWNYEEDYCFVDLPPYYVVENDPLATDFAGVLKEFNWKKVSP